MAVSPVWPAGKVASTPRYGIAHAITLRGFSDLTWDRQGRRLAFVVSTPDTTENTTNYDVYLAERGSVRQLTRNPKGDGSPSFSPGGDTLAYVATRPGDSRPRLYMMSLAGGEPWPVGTFVEAVGEVKWSPDGRYVAFTMNDTLPRVVAERRRAGRDATVEGTRLQYAHLWVIDVRSGEQRRLVGGSNQVWYVRWSPYSKHVAFLVSPSGAVDDGNQIDIGVVPVEGGAYRLIGAIGAAFDWSPDGRWIAWTGAGDRNVYVEKEDVWICGATSGTPRRLTADLDESPTTPAWSRGSDTLYFMVPRGVGMALGSVAVAGGGTHLTRTVDGLLGQLTIGPRGRAAWVESGVQAPDEVMVADHAALAGTRVSELNAAAARVTLAGAHAVHWTSTDGVRVEGMLMRPPGSPARTRLKTLVLLHGGPYGFRDGLGFSPLAQVYACAGYQVFMPNFRSSGGYGAAFMVRRRADWGGQDWRDVSTGVDSLVAAGLVDPDRLAIGGASYGGYLTAWATTQTTRFRCAFMERSIVDLPAQWGQSDARRYRAWEFNGRPWEAHDAMRDRSPLAHVTNVRTPTLILVGDDDARTPIAQSRAWYASLESLGVPVGFVHYPREGHGLREPRHRSDSLDRALAWLDRWIK